VGLWVWLLVVGIPLEVEEMASAYMVVVVVTAFVTAVVIVVMIVGDLV